MSVPTQEHEATPYAPMTARMGTDEGVDGLPYTGPLAVVADDAHTNVSQTSIRDDAWRCFRDDGPTG